MYVFMKLSEGRHLKLHNGVPAKFVWDLLTFRRAVSADASIRKLQKPAEPAKEITALITGSRQSPSSSSTGVSTCAKTSKFPMQTVRNRKMLPIHVPFNSSSWNVVHEIWEKFWKIEIFLQNYKHYMKLWKPLWLFLPFNNTITHILENDAFSYLVIWHAVSLAVSQRERWNTIQRVALQNWLILSRKILCLVPSPSSIQEQGSVK